MSIAQQIETTILSAPGRQLDDIAKTMWKALASGVIDDAAAERLSVAIDARRDAFRAKRTQTLSKPVLILPKPVKSPDRARSIARRRKQAASGALPPDIASHFTMSEQAALAVIAFEIRRTGSCRWYMDKIAAIAGVCRTSARNALRRAQQLGFLTIRERRIRWWRNQSNIISIVSDAWQRWLKLKRGGCKKVQSTNTQFNINGEKTNESPVCSGQKKPKMVIIDYATQRKHPKPPDNT